MPNSKQLFSELVSHIRLNESRTEKESMIYFLLERKCGLSRTDVLAGKEVTVDVPWPALLDAINRSVPVQYIAGEEFFFGRLFSVTPDVLIPRPETELLVREVIRLATGLSAPHVVDVGTGSGCIAITLALELPTATVTGTDVSEKALAVARENAARLKAGAVLAHHNILTDSFSLPCDVLVSNPPYIPLREKPAMNKNVTGYEPHLALFVPDDNPLLFYEALARAGREALRPGGYVMVEIHEAHGAEVEALFGAFEFREIEVKKDVDGKDRMVIARKR